MLVKCEKTVKKSVKKSAQNWWNKNVQNVNNVNFRNCKMVFTRYIRSFTQVFQNFIDKKCTKILYDFYLLNLSFTHFAHRTTITTTDYLIKEEGCR